jgi:hypothetical protein
MSAPLSDWIHRAKYSLSKDEYYECGVELALQLTKRLAVKPTPFSNEISGVLPPPIEDVIPANIFVTRTNTGTTEVHINVTKKKSNNNYSAEINNNRNNYHHHPSRPPTQSQLCFALGKIVFEIFSQGNSYQLLELNYNENNKHKNKTRIDEQNNNNDVCDGILFDDLLVGGGSDISLDVLHWIPFHPQGR